MQKKGHLNMEIVKMTKKHLDSVYKIEKECFSNPWSKKSLEDELFKNKFAIYIVALDENKVIGYGGMWHIINEGHITNIAVTEKYRNQGVATAIVNKLSEIAISKEMIGLTLEVRMANESAKALYTKLGFRVEGIRKEYYSDTLEDALIMWKYFDNSLSASNDTVHPLRHT